MRHSLYNIFSFIWHKILRAPIRMRAGFDIGPKRRGDIELTVVMLHGIAADHCTWRTTINQLHKNSEFKNVRFIALDLLGFGKSPQADWLNYDYADYDRSLDRTLKHLRVKTPVVLIGHSMGGLIAASYATDYAPSARLERLVLVSPPVLMAADLAKLPDKIYTKSYGALHRFAMEVPAADVIAGLVQKFSSFRSTYLKTTSFEKSMEKIILCRSNYHTFTKIRLPTVLLHGHFDPLVMGSNLRRVAKHNHNVKYQSVIGHHDISVGKRAKIELEIRRSLRHVREDKTL